MAGTAATDGCTRANILEAPGCMLTSVRVRVDSLHRNCNDRPVQFVSHAEFCSMMVLLYGCFLVHQKRQIIFFKL